MKRISLFSSILFVPFFFICPLTQADIFVTEDQNGILQFTNKPISKKSRIYIKDASPKKKGPYNSQKFDEVISEASQKHGISFSLLKAVIKVESDFNPEAVSSKGAKGLMQIMPFNYKLLNIKNPFNPFENIMGGTYYLKMMIKRFQGDLVLALAAYNAGPQAVGKYKQVPPFPETKNYIAKVIKYYKIFENRL